MIEVFGEELRGEMVSLTRRRQLWLLRQVARLLGSKDAVE